MFATGVTMGLAEWIIDDTCLVYTCISRKYTAIEMTEELLKISLHHPVSDWSRLLHNITSHAPLMQFTICGLTGIFMYITMPAWLSESVLKYFAAIKGK